MKIYFGKIMDMRAAWEYGKVTSMIRGNGFDSQMFTLTVGPEAKSFTAHAAFLSQSPVFEKMCSGQFQESHTCEIKLPEDNPELIRAFIQYLYTGNFLDFGSLESGHCPKDAASQLAGLYMTAEKYQIQKLKRLILCKLNSVLDPKECPLDFLCIAELMYENIPDSDRAWRTFFKKWAAHLRKPTLMSESVRTVFDNYLHQGGAQAVDMMEAVCTHYEEMLKFVEADAAKLRDKWALHMRNCPQ